MDPEFLRSTYFLDYDHPQVAQYAHTHTQGARTPEEMAVRLFYQIRDEFAYNPYNIDLRAPGLKASSLIGRNEGYCAQKAALMAACCRYLGIQSRLQFYNVRNHLGIGHLQTFLKTDLLVFHSGLQIFLNSRWIKLVPAFDQDLCKKLGVSPLEFDGKSDAIFQQFLPGTNQQFMEYVHDYGCFDDLPQRLVMTELFKYYPHIFTEQNDSKDLKFIARWDEYLLK